MKEENNLQGKTSRLLYFMSELEKGHKVNKTDYLKRFNIAERTFKDDLRELKENLKHTKISSEEISDGRKYSLLFLYVKVVVSC